MISALKEESLEKKDRKWPWSVVYILVIIVVHCCCLYLGYYSIALLLLSPGCCISLRICRRCSQRPVHCQVTMCSNPTPLWLAYCWREKTRTWRQFVSYLLRYLSRHQKSAAAKSDRCVCVCVCVCVILLQHTVKKKYNHFCP